MSCCHNDCHCHKTPFGANKGRMEIVSLALGMISNTPTFRRDDAVGFRPSREYAVAEMHFDSSLDLMLSSYTWYFRRCQIFLSDDQILKLDAEGKIEHAYWAGSSATTLGGGQPLPQKFFNGVPIVSSPEDEYKLFPAFFVQALATKIAAESAIPLKSDIAIKQAMQRDYLGALSAALAADSRNKTSGLYSLQPNQCCCGV